MLVLAGFAVCAPAGAIIAVTSAMLAKKLFMASPRNRAVLWPARMTSTLASPKRSKRLLG